MIDNDDNNDDEDDDDKDDDDDDDDDDNNNNNNNAVQNQPSNDQEERKKYTERLGNLFTFANVDPLPSPMIWMTSVRLSSIWSMFSSQNFVLASPSSSINAPYAPRFNRSSISFFDITGCGC